MESKRTEYVEYIELDELGRIIRRTRKRKTTITRSSTDYGYDYGTRYGGYGTPDRASMRRVMEAYGDHRRSQEW